MKHKIIKMPAVLIVILLIFTLCGCNTPKFTENRTVIAEKIDFTYSPSKLAVDAAASFYKDADGSFVLWWEERETPAYNGIDETDPLYRNSKKQFLIRLNPETYEITEKKQIHEWMLHNEVTDILDMRIALSTFQNSRGNTVIAYNKFGRNGEKQKHHFIFEEYDRDFNLIKTAEFPADSFPGGEEANAYIFAEKDDSDNYYLSGGDRVAVFTPDFEFSGIINDIPPNPGDPPGDETGMDDLLVSKGGDGAVYAYYFYETKRELYKIDPAALTLKFAQNLDIEDVPWLYTGDKKTLFTRNEADITDPAVFYKKDGDYFNIVVEDKDGDSKTLDDYELVLYEFIRK
jgi:hypothetical protein